MTRPCACAASDGQHSPSYMSSLARLPVPDDRHGVLQLKVGEGSMQGGHAEAEQVFKYLQVCLIKSWHACT